MKRLIIISIALLFTGSALLSQSLSTEILYQKYRGEEGVIAIWIPGVAMKLAANIADLDGPEEELLRCVRSLRVLTIDESELYPDVNFAKEIKLNPDKNGFKVLMEIHDGNDDVLILAKEKRGKLKDLLILVGGDDNVMVHIKGRMNADMLDTLAEIAGLDSGIIHI